ncbi:TLC domain-containing protein 2-like [Saccostrea echinata]|uniref:TLC domain-containing protein 2-like n=1 Tax=Saccostrea echinata TaxID=191078 RepID=UPI002A8290F7|nr:TLC domain-containing protein 2-like [Saccostrea echinata]
MEFINKEIWPEEFSGAVYGLTVVFLSFVGFYVLSVFAELLLPKAAEKNAWKWKNISTSLVHSVITGFWSCLCFYDNPKLAEDMIKTHTVLAHTLISVSVGYFIYDTIDMLRYQRNRQSFELMGHHVVIIICFGVSIVSRMYVGYAVVALVIELNSIFLHLRQILQICQFKKDNKLYRLNSIINLGTFVGFRISVMAWMSKWLLINKDLIPFVFYTLGSIGLAVMTIMNIVLFYRLLQSDFIRKKESTVKVD